MNPQQQSAVEAVDGRVLVLAGAGTGKTRVLTHRIAYLINQLQVSPKAILGLTFTNKAAAEMRHRVAGLVQPAEAKHVMLSTFHSFCLQVLRADIHRLGYTSRFSLYDEHDVKRVINYIARDLLDINGELPSIARALSLISQAKNRGDRPDQLIDDTSAWHQEFARNLYARLEEALRAYNAVDFDHLLSLTIDLFENHPDVLDRYQERYRYLMIDEYQDTNPIQYRLAELLSAKYGNLCVVGDDDQSIYGWRGADMRNILNFEGKTTVKLEQNYRSTNTILSAANAVISNNTKRHQKVLWSTCGEGAPIEVFVAPGEVEEAEAIAYRIAKLRESGKLAWRDMAILYRSNALSRQMEKALLKQAWRNGESWVMGIPFRIHGGTEFYERKEVKDLCAYLRIITNPHDQEALLRVINQPRRGIGEKGLDLLTSYNRNQNLPLWDVIESLCNAEPASEKLRAETSQKFREGLTDFVAIIKEARERFEKEPLHQAVKWLITRVDYSRAIREEVKSLQMRAFKEENISEFVNSVVEYEKAKSSHDEEASLEDFIVNLPLNREGNFARMSDENKDCVSLMTFHSAKGLEFPACFLVGVEEGIIPHAKSMEETGIEEERRLMYVAITRAMRYLTVSMSMRRMRMGKEEAGMPSQFLNEIPSHHFKRSNWKSMGDYS